MKLTTFCGHLVPLLDMPMSDFTELQRALKEQSPHFNPEDKLNKAIRAYAEEAGISFDPNLLKGKAGPGGGIELDAFRAAFFLLAVTLNGPRKNSSTATWLTWHLNQEGSELSGWGDNWKPTIKLCPFTGQHLFGEALKKIIEDGSLAARVNEVRVASDLTAEIHYDNGNISKFEKSYRDTSPHLYRLAVVNGMVWQAAAELVKREG
ncbi:hypothetical protein [Methylobacterium sp. J-068]|uniref:hypothetical protein n=1 Tax=Methylobacterium sp. J-068 TaxID=2836649 RepID=UPI001FBAFE7F|nr:hypothetical protein [Methylobacterium sp. J-068]MCJ2033167.1 hypothetical protein [Methylobacterium sp. J-068]